MTNVLLCNPKKMLVVLGLILTATEFLEKMTKCPEVKVLLLIMDYPDNAEADL
jgi:hypothetical protein